MKVTALVAGFPLACHSTPDHLHQLWLLAPRNCIDHTQIFYLVASPFLRYPPISLLLHRFSAALNLTFSAAGNHYFSTAFAALVSLAGCIRHEPTTSKYFV